MHKKLKLSLGLTESALLECKEQALLYIAEKPDKVLNYKKWIESRFSIEAQANDWVSLAFDENSDHLFFRQLFLDLRLKFSTITDVSEFDYLQLHVSNLDKRFNEVRVPPHRDVNRAAGINFGIYNFQHSKIKFYQDVRVLNGQLPPSKTIMPDNKFLIPTTMLEYELDRTYLIDAHELHNVEYDTDFKNDVRVIGAYALRKNNLNVNFSDLVHHLCDGFE